VTKSATTASANPAASAAGDTTAEGGSGAYITGVPDSAAPPVQVASGPQPNLPLAALSLAALVLGIALFALRRAARPA
jgi:hypothetical protein